MTLRVPLLSLFIIILSRFTSRLALRMSRYWTVLRTVCAAAHQCCKPSADCTFSQSVRLWVSQESHGIKLSLSKSCQKHNLWITPQWCWIVDNISGYYSRLLWRILWDCHCVKFSIWFEEISLLTNAQIELRILETVKLQPKSSGFLFHATKSS